uniref:Pyrophosphatefructose 6-phosphate 1-phosphotransferase subunit alpha n=1 Tax=Rhizophora mucronata TaxID=61149 RepID=A0A2P2QWB9_RHIMU
MLCYDLGIGNFGSSPEKVSQRLAISVGEVSANCVGIRWVCSCAGVTKFYPHSCSLKTRRELWMVK